MQLVRDRAEVETLLAGMKYGHIPAGGPSAFYEAGVKQVQRAIDLDVIQQDGRVLDMGCGNGRWAVGLEQQLFQGSYIGVDVVPESIEFCRRLFEDDERFEFHHHDIHNAFYQPEAAVNPERLTLAIADDSIDSVICNSLFTHLERDTAVEHYLRTMRRVTKQGGIAWFSFLTSPPFPSPQAVARKTILRREAVDDMLLRTGWTMVRQWGGTKANSGDHWVVICS